MGRTIFSSLKTIVTVSIPIVLMIGSLEYVASEVNRVLLFALIAIVSLSVMRINRAEAAILVFGIAAMTAAEYFFVDTGVERFAQRTFLDAMPSWLPILWGYAFVAISRGVKAIERIF